MIVVKINGDEKDFAALLNLLDSADYTVTSISIEDEKTLVEKPDVRSGKTGGDLGSAASAALDRMRARQNDS